MLFVLNTVSVLTLIDVPVCFLLLLQTESTHKSGYYRLGGVRLKEKKEKKPFLQLFPRGHSLACHFLFSALADRDNNGRNQRWRDGKRMKRSKMDWEGENIRWVTAEETREPFTEAEPTVNSATQLENHYPTGCDFSNQCQTTDTTSDNSCVSTRPLYFYTMGRVYTVLRCRYSAVSQNS